MGRGRQWQGWELFLLRSAAAENWRRGLTLPEGGFANRLQYVAERTGRSYAAVRKKAHEVDAVSSGPGRPYCGPHHTAVSRQNNLCV